MNADILILGMGFIGRPLAVILQQQGYAVHGIKRSLTSDDINLPIGLDCVDLTQQPALDCYRAPIWVIALPPSAMPDYVATMKWLVQQAQAACITHVVYVSSIGVFGAQQGDCDETTTPQPSSESGQKVQAAEQLWLASGIANVDIVRLAGLYAAERHPLTSLLCRKMPLSGGNVLAHMIHRDVAVDFVQRMIATPNGQRIRHVVTLPAPSKREFYAREARLLGLPAPEWTDDEINVQRRILTRFGDAI